MSARILLSPHFYLDEFLPAGYFGPVPVEVRENLERVCVTLLEPARVALACPFRITSGWRPPAKNAATPGAARLSDHMFGRAADVSPHGDAARSWQEATIALFDWLRENAVGKYGQLILEDHRIALGNPGKLWVHASVTSPKHPGTEADPSRLLVSTVPKQYERWRSPRDGVA